MAHWLVKSEPSVWSWSDMVAAGAAGTHWDGVRNHLAKKHMMAMKRGETAFFYHSNEERAVVGIVEIIREFYPAPDDPPFGMIDVRAARPLERPVSLAAIKAEPRLAEMILVRNSRLSVQPVSAAEWKSVCEMGGRV